MDDIIKRIKYFEFHPNDINVNRFLDKRVHKEDLLRELKFIVEEIITDIQNHPLILNSSRYIIVDHYIFSEKYLPIQKEIIKELIKKFQYSGLPKAFIEVVQGVIIIHPNF